MEYPLSLVWNRRDLSSEKSVLAEISRRRWLLGGVAFAGLTACRRERGTGYPGYALVATAGQKSVAAVDLTAFRLEKSIAVPGSPAEVIANRSGGAFVLLPDSGTVCYIGPGLQVDRSRKVADHLSALRLMPTGDELVAVSPNSRELLVLDAASFKVVKRVRLHGAPSSIDVSQTGDSIVTASESGGINLINRKTGEWRHAQLQGATGRVAFRFDSQLVLVANPQERILTALRVPDLRVVTELPLAMEPRNLCFTPDGGQLFVSGPGMDAVAIVFPYNSLEVEQTVLVGPQPGPMACSGSPGYLFVGSAQGSDVSIMRVDNRKAVGSVNVESQPGYLTLTPDGQYALVLCEQSGDLAVIRVGAIRPRVNKTGAALFTMLPVGEKPVHCAFVPRQLA